MKTSESKTKQLGEMQKKQPKNTEEICGQNISPKTLVFSFFFFGFLRVFRFFSAL